MAAQLPIFIFLRLSPTSLSDSIASGSRGTNLDEKFKAAGIIFRAHLSLVAASLTSVRGTAQSQRDRPLAFKFITFGFEICRDCRNGRTLTLMPTETRKARTKAN